MRVKCRMEKYLTSELLNKILHSALIERAKYRGHW